MRRLKKAILTALAICCALPLQSGCWNRRELDDLAIQLGTAIDKVGSQYRVAVQVVIPGEVSARSSSSGISPVTLYHATAPTIFEAFRKLTETSPRKVYSAHVRVLVIGESLAREGIAKALDMFSRNPEARTDFYLMISRNTTAMQVLKTLTSLEKIPAENLFYALDTSAKNWSPTTTVTIEQLIEQLVKEAQSPVLTGVNIMGNPRKGEQLTNVEEIDPAAQQQFTGLAVFRKDKLVGWLNETHSRGYNYIMNNVKSSAGHLECPAGGLLTLETVRSYTRLKADVINGEPVITVKVKNISQISDVECRITLSDPQSIKEIEKSAAERLEAVIKSTVEHVQKKYGFDVFGFGQAVYRSHPREWKRMRENWNDKFRKLKVNYDVKIEVHKVGSTNDSFLNYIKE